MATRASAGGVPEPLERYVERSVPDHCAVPKRVRITQEGEMWQRPRGPALHFTATQVLAVERVEFALRAHWRGTVTSLAVEPGDGTASDGVWGGHW